MKRTTATLVIVSLLVLVSQLTLAGSATWSANPTSDDWNTATNWTPNTVPNGPADIATFDFSNLASVTINKSTTVDSIVFNAGASAYTITDAAIKPLNISGAGIVNDSGLEQNLQVTEVAEIEMMNSATISGPTSIYLAGTSMTFDDDAGFIVFSDSSSPGDASITAGRTASTYIPSITLVDSASAGNAALTAEGGSLGYVRGGVVGFEKSSTAANSTIICEGGSSPSTGGGAVEFFDNASAASATITANGGSTSGAGGGLISFISGQTASSTLIVNGGIDGGLGAQLLILGTPREEAKPRVEVFGNGNLNLSLASATFGSLEGDGLVYLDSHNLSIGANGLSTVCSGTIQDGNTAGGSLAKTGTDTLTLSGANTYTGGTTVSQGTLLISNQSSSGTGTGAVQVNAGTLGGSGIIAGAVTVGTASGAGAVLAPAAGGISQATLTTQGTLTLLADSTYKCTAKAKGRQVRTDSVVANGVTISGAKFSFRPKISGTLRTGTVFTVIKNTSANPISGSFSNLADGAIISAGSTNFQANYEGGDGNDLTLTVVP
jgi:autotransporter-associated beta strand protein